MGMLWHTPGYIQIMTACVSSSRGTLKALWLNLVYAWNFLGKLQLCSNDAKKFVLVKHMWNAFVITFQVCLRMYARNA